MLGRDPKVTPANRNIAAASPTIERLRPAYPSDSPFAGKAGQGIFAARIILHLDHLYLRFSAAFSALQIALNARSKRLRSPSSPKRMRIRCLILRHGTRL